MSVLTMDQLNAMLADCADRDDDVTVDLTAETADTAFDSLGFDSLALFNVIVRIEEQFGIRLTGVYDVVAQAKTPSGLLDVINTTGERGGTSGSGTAVA